MSLKKIIIDEAKEDLLKALNIKDNTDVSQLLDVILPQCYKLGWLDQYKDSFSLSLQVD